MPIYLKKLPRGARRNMAIRYGGAEWDTWGEVPAEIKKLILGGAAPPSPPRQRTDRPPVPPPTGLFDPEPKTQKRGKLYRDVYAKIAKSIGGWRVVASICPEIESYPKGAGRAYARALQSMGLTPAKAEAVAAAMKAENVLVHGSGSKYAKGPAAAERAKAILLSVGGIHCPGARRNRNFSW